MTAQRFTRLAPSADATVTGSRVVTYQFSDESVGRDGHIVKASAWMTENFEKNPVFLWGHLDSEPPIGKVFGLHTENRTLCGAVKYAESEFADSIYQLVRDGYLNATSTSWMPIEWDRLESGGCCFTAVDLLEISQVCIPALPTALATARSRGLNIRPIAAWASRSLDARNYRAATRPELEAIYRAASSPVGSSSSSTRAERAAKARELVERGKRLDKAFRIRDVGSTKEESDVSENMREAHDHMQRALRRHKDLAGHVDEIGEQLKNLRDVHRAFTNTLSELGIEDKSVARAMKDLDRCARALRTSHTGAEDAADAAAGHVNGAAEIISTAVAAK